METALCACANSATDICLDKKLPSLECADYVVLHNEDPCKWHVLLGRPKDSAADRWETEPENVNARLTVVMMRLKIETND